MQSKPNGSILVYPSGAVYKSSTSPIQTTSSMANMTFWGYGAKFVMTGNGTNVTQSGIYMPSSGGGMKVYGFEIAGVNTLAGTNNAAPYAQTGKGEQGMGIIIGHNGTNNDGEIADVWVHNVYSDGIYSSGNPGTSTNRWHIHHNLIELNGRMLITHDQGDDWTVEYNILRDAALQSYDVEDAKDGTRYVRRLHLQNNLFDRWNWYYKGTVGGTDWYENTPIGFVNHVGELAGMSDIYVENNKLTGGSKGHGSGGTYGGLGANFGLIFFGNNQPSPMARSNIFIRNNDFSGIPAAQHVGPGIGTSNVTNLTITGNTGMSGLTVVHTADTAPTTVSNNN